MYVIKRTDKGGYVAKPGSRNAYTLSYNRLRTFDTYEAANRERCPDNEVVVSLESIRGLRMN